MRWHNVLLLAAAILISGCKEEKLAVGAPAPALAAFDLQGQESGLERWHALMNQLVIVGQVTVKRLLELTP